MLAFDTESFVDGVVAGALLVPTHDVPDAGKADTMGAVAERLVRVAAIDLLAAQRANVATVALNLGSAHEAGYWTWLSMIDACEGIPLRDDSRAGRDLDRAARRFRTPALRVAGTTVVAAVPTAAAA